MKMDGDSAFQPEVVFTDFRERTHLIRGSVRWYRLSKPEKDIRRFQAGVYLKDAESRTVARNIVESITPMATNRGEEKSRNAP